MERSVDTFGFSLLFSESRARYKNFVTVSLPLCVPYRSWLGTHSTIVKIANTAWVVFLLSVRAAAWVVFRCAGPIFLCAQTSHALGDTHVHSGTRALSSRRGHRLLPYRSRLEGKPPIKREKLIQKGIKM